jgi:hypothetical protein
MDMIRFFILRKNLIFKVPLSPEAEILLWVTNPPHTHIRENLLVLYL